MGRSRLIRARPAGAACRARRRPYFAVGGGAGAADRRVSPRRVSLGKWTMARGGIRGRRRRREEEEEGGMKERETGQRGRVCGQGPKAGRRVWRRAFVGNRGGKG